MRAKGSVAHVFHRRLAGDGEAAAEDMGERPDEVLHDCAGALFWGANQDEVLQDWAGAGACWVDCEPVLHDWAGALFWGANQDWAGAAGGFDQSNELHHEPVGLGWLVPPTRAGAGRGGWVGAGVGTGGGAGARVGAGGGAAARGGSKQSTPPQACSQLKRDSWQSSRGMTEPSLPHLSMQTVVAGSEDPTMKDDTLVNTAGISSPHTSLPKETTPTTVSSSGVLPLRMRGPPESPWHASAPPPPAQIIESSGAKGSALRPLNFSSHTSLGT
mmetsp:Transcript_12347/g.29325  ORF Transcript_12347/g.29325 Transcript_12347/m.29325 type:complete len:272 (-) Transcript_12347:907-1722(-)